MLSLSHFCQINRNSEASAAATTTTWTLTLTPSGIRINTNITNIHELYQILLQGITRLEINNRAWINVPSFVSSSSSHNNVDAPSVVSSYYYPRLVEQGAPAADLELLVHSCYQPCFLPYQIVDQRAFLQTYHDPQSPQELLLVNSIHAWVEKHTSIYHHTPSSSAVVHAAGEGYFLEAKQLLRRCFTISNATTIHALLNLYMYQLSCERTTLAYLYIGLAIRMAEDLRLHKRDRNTLLVGLKQKEINKRLWWSVYWLDLCAALESNRPTMVDDKDCDIDYPTRLPDEDDETGYRIAFSVASIQLMKIRKAIAKHLPSEGKSGPCLLDAVAHLESRLEQWLQALPSCFSFSAASNRRTTAFCDEACLILNIQYHTSWVMLHKLFLKEPDIADSPVALLSLDVCIRSANLITQLLQMYAKQPHWCHFYYCLDGVAESVYIHQKSVSCNTTDALAKQTALDHLTTTIQILYESPLNYMQKVKDIIRQVRHLLVEELGQQILLPSPPQSQSPPQGICQTLAAEAVTTERILLRHPHVNITDFIQPTFSNEELNQMLSIYNNDESI
ncbi:fungal-specific transcription factor [Mucor lusitanicus CBS 277.49]|uniref:Fungal-specific transcription factor n=1 Tax=Mucor lusitanicus CBS 277.49 TaxID=747725 RepID=A0A162QSF8_MUCCL|nr:fungal-specific transcription factor [Mucor lusitanicus CBS 277.49]